jgi:hypothetical protein
MMETDDQIRSLLGEALQTELVPMTPDELHEHLAEVGLQASGTRHRPTLMLVAACTVALGLVAAGAVIATRHRNAQLSVRAPGAAANGATVDHYFVPTTLPTDYRLLAFSEGAGDPAATAPATAVYGDPQSGARVSLSESNESGRWSSSDHTTKLPSGTVKWTYDATRKWASFQLDTGSRLIDGEALGVDSEQLLAILGTARADGGGDSPTLADQHFTVIASTPTVAAPVAAESVAYYGTPGGDLGASSIKISVTRSIQTINPDLDGGVWTQTVQTNGRTIHLGPFNSTPYWYPAPNIKVTVNRYGTTAEPSENGILAALKEVDGNAIEQAISSIDDTAQRLAAGQSVTFPSGATAHLLLGTTNQPAGLCLTISATRRCDLALMAHSSYTDAGQLVDSYADFIVNGDWFTVAIEPTSAEPIIGTGVETVESAGRRWQMIQHSPQSLLRERTVSIGSPTRPAR